MKTELTKPERRAVRCALSQAIAWEETVIDSYRIAYPKRYKGGAAGKVIPPEWRKEANRSRRNIARFERLLRKLNEANANNPSAPR